MAARQQRATQFAEVPDTGRRVAFEVSGDTEGTPVFLLHGMPGSGAGIRPRNVWLIRNALHLITPDRPGYGDSDPFEGRRIVDGAADILAIADKLEIPQFGVVGRSVGGAHALACAARIPKDRPRRVRYKAPLRS